MLNPYYQSTDIATTVTAVTAAPHPNVISAGVNASVTIPTATDDTVEAKRSIAAVSVLVKLSKMPWLFFAVSLVIARGGIGLSFGGTAIGAVFLCTGVAGIGTSLALSALWSTKWEIFAMFQIVALIFRNH